MRLRYSRLLIGFLISASFIYSRPSFAQEWGSIREKNKGSVLYIEVVSQNRDGTNRHKSTATGFVGALKFPIEVINWDLGLDLAVFSLPDLQIWKPIEFGESNPVPAEAQLYVLGFPLNSDLDSGEGRLSNPRGPHGRWQTTLPLNYGNSGGPVFDIGGKVIGVAAGGYDEARSMTIVIPSDYLRPLRSLVAAALEPSSPNLKRFTFIKSVDDQQSAEVREVFCLPEGKKVVSFTPNILSKNGSDTQVISTTPVPDRPNCVNFKAYVAGKGVENYGPIVVGHKGRGWLSGYMAVYGN
jgi:Trypsin-like peptidase domain